jgi:hypothetical protein
MIAALEGRALTRIDGSAHPGDWLFYFQEDCFVRVGCDWRIVSDERIALASQDHEQMFGRSTPLDGVAAASKLLVGAKVVKASINPVGDIVVRQ